MTEIEDKDLLDIIGEDLANQPGYATSSGYLDWERKVAEPALKGLGYKVRQWWTSDGDSFGPLVRAVNVEREGKREIFYYG